MRVFYTLLIVLSLSFISCGKKEDSKRMNGENPKLKVGLVFDVGGRGDKSFNDAAYEGLERAQRELGIEFEVIDPGDGADRESALRKLASKEDVGLIFGVGFIFTEDINAIAEQFPNKMFGCIDYSVSDPNTVPKNVLALEFKEEEGSFLVGAIAGLKTKTNKVGFLGGMESALIKKFEAGYVQGVKYVNPSCEVLTGYVSVTAEGFKNPGKGQEISLSQYSNGADIIYHASGLSGIGLFEAARDKKLLAIGVDLDQYKEAPGHVLTSMTKQVEEAIFQTVKDVVSKSFKGGVKTFGLKDNGVSYVYDDNNKNLIGEDVHARVEEIKGKIIKGEIAVKEK